ncbi:Cell division cycle-associated 7-like protein [Linum perenne]
MDRFATPTPKISVYEQTREETIRANLERMQKLGLKDLSLKLTSLSRSKPKRRSFVSRAPVTLDRSSLRRSSRLQKLEPPSYAAENRRMSKRRVISNEEGLVKFREGRKREIFSVKPGENVLGSTERSWTLCEDGYGEDGRRVYDQINGKSCHQCRLDVKLMCIFFLLCSIYLQDEFDTLDRQKTLGHRTHCSNCEMIQGQFCGDCLYMRYGEHVLEALDNPDWVCPVCRGICNCSLCRQSKGLAPTGILYRKITKLGYKSVAHYLAQIEPSKNNVNNSFDPVSQDSAERSPCDINDRPVEPHSQDKLHDEGEEMRKLEGTESAVMKLENNGSLCSSDGDLRSAQFVSATATPPRYETRRRRESKLKGEEEEEEKSCCTKLGKTSCDDDDSVGARVRQRCRTGDRSNYGA